MAKKLIIVESPTKCKTISKIVGKDYSVISTLGHIRDLPKHRIGVDVEHDFNPTYEIPKDKARTVKAIKDEVKKISEIYVATDEDREGEAIGWHVLQSIGVANKKIKRIAFHEITSDAILSALKKPRKINQDLVDAQQARRILDRLVGYTLSPLLSKKIYKGLSAGRVQSVAVRIIAEREKEIQDFKNQEYWTVKAECRTPQDENFYAHLVSKGKKKFKKLDIQNKKQVDEIIKGVDKEPFVIQDVQKKDKKRNPLPPFITSTLQQTASRALGLSAKQTMFIAQELYEGISLGGGDAQGLITYMRTDSPTVASTARNDTAKYIKNEYGQEYLPVKPRRYTSKVKNAQEAHECIRPTLVNRAPQKIKQYLNKKQFALYKLIWERFVSSQMKEALYEQTLAKISAKDTLWHANGQVMVFDGFLKVHEDKNDEGEGKEATLPRLEKNETVKCEKIIPEQHFTEPPPRYNEATLIKALESYGIGRPSTYAPTISTILYRGYVRLEKKRFFPEDIGMEVTNILKEYFADIVDINFTANMEQDLDKVALGKKPWVKLMQEFYNPFIKTVKSAEKTIESQKVEISIGKKCPKCGADLIERRSRYGNFIGCSGFPKCKYIEPKNSKETEALEKSLEPCPVCSGKLVVKGSRFGKFIACDNYPKCRYTQTIGDKIEKTCPECSSPMVVRFSKRGKFLGCSKYPDCKHIEKMPQEKGSDIEQKKIHKKKKK